MVDGWKGKMKHYCKIATISMLIVFSVNVSAQFAQPFKWNASSKGNILTVRVDVPPAHYLYGDNRTRITVTGPDAEVEPISTPFMVDHADNFGSGKIIPAGHQEWKFKIRPDDKYSVKVEFQGCRENTAENPGVCFIPSEVSFSINDDDESLTFDIEPKSPPILISEGSDLSALLANFELVNISGGYLDKDQFLAFLGGVQDGLRVINKDWFEQKSFFVIIFLVLIGGLALNLTPCVLPLIPVNLAIIGAGGINNKKRQGFLRGGVYGIGIAVAYGLLGVITVLSGAKFGTLNSVFWFNFLIAAVFVLLALAMFDVFTIDFSRFTGRRGMKKLENGSLIPVFVMGSLAALLAGACVAPVVIAVLLYSTNLYSSGRYIGLILPFVLGLGMALPWPFAGAGMALLPKPGKWMIRIKQVFAGVILLFAVYYFYIGITLLKRDNASSPNSFAVLKEALLQAEAEHKPVFIDFWASWCKNCTQMERTTFKDPEVLKKLDSFVLVKFQAEQPGEAAVKELLDRFNLIGLPGYVILKPKKAEEK